MRFRIIGAERQTGADVDKVIEAPSQTAAEAQAHDMGVMVQRIERVGGIMSAIQQSPADPPELRQLASAVSRASADPVRELDRSDRARYQRSVVRALWAIFVALAVLAGVALEARWKWYRFEQAIEEAAQDLDREMDTMMQRRPGRR